MSISVRSLLKSETFEDAEGHTVVSFAHSLAILVCYVNFRKQQNPLVGAAFDRNDFHFKKRGTTKAVRNIERKTLLAVAKRLNSTIPARILDTVYGRSMAVIVAAETVAGTPNDSAEPWCKA